MVLPGVLEKHKLGYVRGGEITPSGRVCLQSHSGWGTCALAAEHRGREGTHTEGAPKQRGLKAPQKQEGKTGRTLLLQVLSSSKSSNTPHFFFFRWLKKRSAQHLIFPRKIATSWGALLLLPNHRLQLHRDGLSVNNLGACPGQAQAGCA